MKKIDYWSAIEWICDECGRNNFSSMITPELPEEELNKIKEELGVQPWEDGELCWTPEEVICRYCKETFKLNDTEDERIL